MLFGFRYKHAHLRTNFTLETVLKLYSVCCDVIIIQRCSRKRSRTVVRHHQCTSYMLASQTRLANKAWTWTQNRADTLMQKKSTSLFELTDVLNIHLSWKKHASAAVLAARSTQLEELSGSHHNQSQSEGGWIQCSPCLSCCIQKDNLGRVQQELTERFHSRTYA